MLIATRGSAIWIGRRSCPIKLRLNWPNRKEKTIKITDATDSIYSSDDKFAPQGDHIIPALTGEAQYTILGGTSSIEILESKTSLCNFLDVEDAADDLALSNAWFLEHALKATAA